MRKRKRGCWKRKTGRRGKGRERQRDKERAERYDRKFYISWLPYKVLMNDTARFCRISLEIVTVIPER